MKLSVKTVNEWGLKGVVVTKESIVQLHEFSKTIENEDIRKGFESLVNILQKAYEECV